MFRLSKMMMRSLALCYLLFAEVVDAFLGPAAVGLQNCRSSFPRCCATDTAILTEENVMRVLGEAKEELGTLFGNLAENRAVGITGDVEFVEIDGPVVVVSLTGRYWHTRGTVLDRVSSYIRERIPECIEVTVSDPAQLLEEDGPQR